MFVSPSPLNRDDLAFFSGFVAGDGCFLVRENNAGASWCCTLDVKLRADNTPLLAEFRESTGAGELFAAAARGGSHPQTSWVVAVELWVAHGGASTSLPGIAAELRALHHSIQPVPCQVDITAPDLAPFLSGFASAEAHFGASPDGSPAFVINLRADDAPLLCLFQHTFEVGHLRDIAPSGRSQQAFSWRVGRLTDLRRLVEWLDIYPPRGRSAYIYEAWRELVMLESRTSFVRRRLALEIRRRRRFISGLDAIQRVPRSERGRRRCEEALRRWALSSDYPGSAVDYERWRRSLGRGAPTRNTIAAAFGSWLEALDALGLNTTRSRSREEIEAIRDGNAASYARRRARSRDAILAAVRCCIAELGREPRATEFLRWRAARAPKSPGQMTIYRRFPGGFSEVIAAATATELDELAA